MDAEAHQEIARGLFRESNDALILFDPRDDKVVDINPAAQRITGFDRKAACALTVWDLFRGDGPDDLRGLIQAYHKTGFFHSREGYWLARASGPPIAVNVSVSRLHTKPEPLGLAVARDVSERKRAQEDLDRFFRLAPDLLAIFGPDGKFVRLNPAWTQTLGYPLDVLKAIEPWTLVRSEDREATLRALGPSPDAGEVAGFENRWRARDGSERVLSWRAVRADGLTYAVARDLTESRRLGELQRQTEALRVAKDAAEAANRAKSEFLAGMSHELRTPMTSILGFAELLLDDEAAPAPPRLADGLRTIRQNGLHLLELIDDLLDLAKIEAGKLRIEPAACSPRRLAEEVAAALAAKAEAKGLDLRVEVEPPLPETIRTDAGRLRQVLMNLVGNAVKFTEAGSVRLRVRRVDAGPAVQFEVGDTGIGMSEAVLGRVFEPFYRAPTDPDRDGEGTGLGLAISSRLVELLGGTLVARSTPGVGSTFLIAVPVGSAPPPTAVAKAAATAAPARLDGHLLVAEDNEANRRVVTLHLERAHARVEAASNGREALERTLAAEAAGDPFDLVLMDMQMPVMDGYEATRQLRARGFEAPIVALTASAMPEDREECLRVGCNDHLSKPIDRLRLLEVLSRHLAGSR